MSIESGPKLQCPQPDWATAWNELRGYVQEATEDGMPFRAADVLAFMDELRERIRQPIRDWMREVGGNEGES